MQRISLPAGTHGSHVTAVLVITLVSAMLEPPAWPAETATGTVSEDAGHTLHTHVPLIASPALTVAAVVATTVTRFPSQPELAARIAESDALATAGSSLLSSAPSVYLSHLNDAPLDDLGQREFDAGIELPLWRIGQKSAARGLGESASIEARAAAAALRWQIAGLVRRSLWDIEAAANALELSRESVDTASELVRIVERRVAAGDLPAGDTLLARTALYERQIDAVDREAELLDAERAYRSLTGLDERPTVIVEARAPREDFDAAHPALALVAAEIDRARAGRELAEKSSRGNPTLTIGEHRQRDPLGTFYSNSLTMEFRLPIGGERYGAVSRAQASRRVAESESTRGLLLRQLDLALHEAEHDLFVVEQSLEIVTERTALAERQWDMGQTAFELGEIDLRDLLRVQDTLLAARSDVRRFETLRNRAIAEINQALGELP